MIDLYCERTGPGLWAEPLNASSNLAFFVAAWASWALARRLGVLSPGVWVLLGLIITVGIGSSLFHTFATPWARLLDVIPILLFQLAYLWLYSRDLIGMGRGYAAGVLAAFFVAAYGGRHLAHLLNGSLFYAPAFLVILILGLYHYHVGKEARGALLAGAAVFSAGVLCRTIDNAICPSFPLGTHFLWHLLMPVVIFLIMWGLEANLAAIPTPALTKAAR